MKKCFKCGVEKSIGSFYVHKQMKDGHLNKCIDCTKNDSKERELKLRCNPEWLEKEKKRSREKYYRLDYKTKYKPDSYVGLENKFRKKYPEKYKANMAVNIIKTKGEKHHWSYNIEHHKDFIELDKKTHNKLHRYTIYDQERMMYRCAITINEFKQGEGFDSKFIHNRYLMEINNLE